MFDLLDLYIWATCSCLGCAVGIYFGYWLRKRDEADGVVSALKTAIDEQRVPDAVCQQVLVSYPPTLLLAWVHWKLRYGSRHAQPAKPEDYKLCRSIASRIMLIKPVE